MCAKSVASDSNPTSDAWYACKGAEQDVVVSTKSSLARNLANFPFPSRLEDRESDRIRSIVFDAFHFLKDADKFQAVPVSKLDLIGNKIMRERDILSSSTEGKQAGIIMRTDGRLSCTVNTDDHVTISSFSSGMNIDYTTRTVYETDTELQKHVQFAASYEFGYLTASIMNCGSGLSIYAKVHLPASSMLKTIQNIAENSVGKEYNFIATYGAGGAGYVSGNQSVSSSLGSYYTISTASSAAGTEFDQITSMHCVLQKVVKEERNAREICKKKHITEIKNYAYRALSLARSSIFVSLRESIEIISGVKFGVDMGIFSGIEVETLHALLYRVQEGHLEFILDDGHFKFEKDIDDDRQKKIDRIRAMILQEAFENVEK